MPEKKLTVNRKQERVGDQKRKLFPASYLLITSQQGIAQLILLLFLVASIAAGTYIVQNRTSFLPHAEDFDPGPVVVVDDAPPSNDTGGSGGGSSGGSSGGSGGGGCRPVTYCDGGKVIEKTCDSDGSEHFKPHPEDGSCGDEDESGNRVNRPDGTVIRMPASSSGQAITVGSDGRTTSDGQSLDSQRPETQDMFYKTYCHDPQNPKCDEAKQQWAREHSNTTVSVNADGKTTSDGQSLATQSPETQRSYSAKYCGGNATANCDAAQRAWAADHVVDVANPKPLTEAERLAAQTEAVGRLKETLNATRDSLDHEGIYKNLGSDAYIANCIKTKTQEDCDNRTKVLEEIIQAQKAHDYAATLTGVSQQAAYTQFTLLARAANCDAVAAGIAGSNCVLDMGDRSNPITARVCPPHKIDSNGNETCAESEKISVRVFLGCSSKDFSTAADDVGAGACRKILNYRDASCNLQNDNLTSAKCQIRELPKAAITALGLGTKPGEAIYDMNKFPQTLIQSAQTLCLSIEKGCILAGRTPAAQPPATNTPAAAPPTFSSATSCELQCKAPLKCLGVPGGYTCRAPAAPPPPAAAQPPCTLKCTPPSNDPTLESVCSIERDGTQVCAVQKKQRRN